MIGAVVALTAATGISSPVGDLKLRVCLALDMSMSAAPLIAGSLSNHAAIGYMPQHDLLLPWRNALDNATVGLEVAGTARAVARARVLPLFREF